MTPDENDNDFDVQDDLDQQEVQQKPSLQQAWQSNPLLKIAGVVLGVAVLVGGYMTLTKPNPIEETKSMVRGPDTAGVSTTPGKDTLDKAYVAAVEAKNKANAERAAATGSSSMPTSTSSAKDQGLAIPQTSSSSESDPLQEWKKTVEARRLKAEAAAPVDDITAAAPQPDVVPMVQPIRPQQVTKVDPQAAAKMAGQMKTLVATLAPAKSSKMSVTSVRSLWDKKQEEDKKAAADATAAQTKLASAAGGGGGRYAGTMADGGGGTSSSGVASAKTIVPAGNIAYAQLLTEMNSDVPAPALATIMSGPFAGGRALGKMETKDEYIVLTFNRIVKDGVSYTVNGIALDEGTTLPAQRTSIDHHYLSRVILPMAADFVSGYGSAVSQTGTTTTTTAGGGVATEQPKPDPTESIYKGVEKASTTLGEILNEDAKKQPTIRVARGTTMGILFLDSVTTQSTEQ